MGRYYVWWNYNTKKGCMSTDKIWKNDDTLKGEFPNIEEAEARLKQLIEENNPQKDCVHRSNNVNYTAILPCTEIITRPKSLLSTCIIETLHYMEFNNIEFTTIKHGNDIIDIYLSDVLDYILSGENTA